jgi:hypothetical protein
MADPPIEHHYHEAYSGTNRIPTVQEHEAKRQQQLKDESQDVGDAAAADEKSNKAGVNEDLKREKAEMMERMTPGPIFSCVPSRERGES